MPNTTSAKKAVRKTARRSRMRTMVRKVEEAIASGQKEAALQALAVAEPILARTAQKGVIHKNTASRKVSRLVARIRAMPD